MQFNRSLRWLALSLAVALTGCGGGGGGGSSTAPAPAVSYTDATAYSSDGSASLAMASEIMAVTKHTLALPGGMLAYTATAGHLTARAPGTGADEASFFYVAYTLDNAAPGTRPVTFFYNGGPGSATMWLHLGSFGPKRLVTGDPATTVPTPFPFVDNEETLLDVSDLVFVDAVGTGFSEAIAPNTNQTFWGVDADAAVFRDFIMRYVAANGREASPKYLFGESYGTTRSAVLANLLETAGVHLAGVVLQSSVLNYNTNCGVVTLPLSCAGYLPTYSATGAWYALVNPPGPDVSALPAFMTQMRTLTTTRYAPALAMFLSNAGAPDPSLLAQLVTVTGVSLANWQTHFNLDPGYFQFNLLPGILIGRYDSRVNAPFGSPLASEGDPSSTFITPSFTATITSYLSTSLNYTNPSPYVALGNAINTWQFRHDTLPLPDTIPDLAAAMAQNPQLKVLSLNGYHDLATPFFQTESDLARLAPNPNIQIRDYVGGHMTYLNDASRVLEKADLDQFYQGGAP